MPAAPATRGNISRRFMVCASANDARPLALHDGLDFLDVDHRGVAWCGHRKRAMRRAVFDCRLRPLAFHEAVREARGETIAAAHAVIDLEVFAHHRLVEV